MPPNFNIVSGLLNSWPSARDQKFMSFHDSACKASSSLSDATQSYPILSNVQPNQFSLHTEDATAEEALVASAPSTAENTFVANRI